jgi:hypothetical protein
MSFEPSDKAARFNALVEQLRAVVSGCEMFGPRVQKKIITRADKVLAEMRKARKLQVLADSQERAIGKRRS